MASDATNRSASWTTVTERSGDTAFARTEIKRTIRAFARTKGGVALRFPPHSKARRERFQPALTTNVLWAS